MTEDLKDFQEKYLELPKVFHNKANDIMLWQKQSARTCEAIARTLAKERPKTPQEFERHENLKDFVLKTATANGKVVELLEYIQVVLEDITRDSETLIDMARIRNQLRDQSATIEGLIEVREMAIKMLQDEKRGRNS